MGQFSRYCGDFFGGSSNRLIFDEQAPISKRHDVRHLPVR
jgi:hypothetical protein